MVKNNLNKNKIFWKLQDSCVCIDSREDMSEA